MDNEQRIRERVRAIWEAEGRPSGRDQEFRTRAIRELGLAGQAPEAAPVEAGEDKQGLVNQGSSPVTPISGDFAQEEPPYAGVGDRPK